MNKPARNIRRSFTALEANTLLDILEGRIRRLEYSAAENDGLQDDAELAICRELVKRMAAKFSKGDVR